MNIKCLVLSLSAMIPILSYSADAVNINVTGNIVASPCIVNGGANSLYVDLGNIQATALAAPGSSSTAVPFTLTVTNCPTGTSTVRADIGGLASHDSPNLYENSGTAGNASVVLYDGVTGDYLGLALQSLKLSRVTVQHRWRLKLAHILFMVIQRPVQLIRR